MTGTNTITATLLAVCMIASATAAAERNPVPEEALAGRWLTPSFGEPAQQFDMTRCGDGWCGITVEANGKCGRAAFRLKPDQTSKRDFTGSFIRVEGAEPYAVGLRITERDGKSFLFVSGHTGENFQPFRRSYPFHIEMSRQGDAVCKADVAS